jgi:uncharacterized cupin superfamily protein
MSHALVNLADVEDAAARRGAKGLQARFVRQVLGCTQHALSQQRLDPGVRQPFAHRHREQEELFVVTAGSGRAKLDDEIVGLRAGDVLRVEPATVRAFEAGPDGLELLVVGGVGLDDVEMVQGFWID